jgi:cell division protease FtsH
MESDQINTQQASSPGSNGKGPNDRADGGRPRPPGPEERRGATATSGDDRRKPQPSLGDVFRTPRFWITLVLLLALNWLLVPLLFPEPNDRVTVPYTFFREQVQAGNVLEITSRGDDIQGTFKQPVTAPPEPVPPGATPTPAPPTSLFGNAPDPNRTYSEFATIKPAFEDRELLPLLQQNNVVITARPLEGPRSPLTTFLLAFGPTALLIGAFIWLNRRLSQQAGGAFSFGRSRARRYEASGDENRITFADVAGIDEVEQELVEVVDFLKNPAKYQRLGGVIPKGVLLVGPPGTGKTLLARAVAGEAGVPFFSMSGSEFIEMIVGVGAARVRDLFAEARKNAPAIIFVDELDAIGRRRGGGNAIGGNDEREQTLNQLLIEMDGFDARSAVIVLAATNRSDVLDPALLRPGRFDRRVTVQPPDRAGRREILKVHTRGVPLAPDINLDAIAAETPGLVGADLRNLVNEAALLAARKNKNDVGTEDFSEAIEKIALGAERRLVLNPQERERVAYHEAGHALLGMLQPEADPVRRVTVVPRGQALGVTLSVPEDDRYNYNEAYLRARIVGALGGRAAEQIVYGSVTTGAENDIKQVTDLARAMVTRWGMSPEIGLQALSGTNEGNFLEDGLTGGASRPFSDSTAESVDRAVRRIIDESYEKALRLLTENRERLDALTQALLREDSLDERQMREATGLTNVPNIDPVAVER